jgi:transcriptional regulator with XRE-family HTH domain
VPSLLRHRTRLALSQDDLATKAGVTRSTVARGEHGLSIRPSSVRKLARALRVSPEALQLQPPEEPPG